MATDALVIEVADDAGARIFFVGEDGTTVEAAWISAVVTGGGDGLLKRSRAGSAVDEADVAPRLGFVETVEGVTGDDTGLAAAA